MTIRVRGTGVRGAGGAVSMASLILTEVKFLLLYQIFLIKFRLNIKSKKVS